MKRVLQILRSDALQRGAQGSFPLWRHVDGVGVGLPLVRGSHVYSDKPVLDRVFVFDRAGILEATLTSGKPARVTATPSQCCAAPRLQPCAFSDLRKKAPVKRALR